MLANQADSKGAEPAFFFRAAELNPCDRKVMAP
jgi:hypothetical protein